MFCFHTSLASKHISPTSWNLRTGHVTCNVSYAKENHHHPLVREALMLKISTRPHRLERITSLVARRLPALRESIPRHLGRSSQNAPTHRLSRLSIENHFRTSSLTTQQAALITVPLSLSNHGRHNCSTSRLSSTPFNPGSTPSSMNYAQASPSRCGTLPLRQPILRRPSKVSIGYPMTGR